MGDAVASPVESLGRIGKCGFVIRLQFDRTTKTTASAASGAACTAIALGGGLRAAEVTHLAGELDVSIGHLAGEGDVDLAILDLE